MNRFLFAVAALGLTAASSGAQAAGPSAWDDIMSTKTLKACVTQYPPNSFKDPSGQWKGFVPDMAADVAKTMNVKLELVESSWKNIVLDIQTGRCHVILGLTATPERALAMDFAGPIYATIFSVAAKKGLDAKIETWEQLNDPAKKVSVVMGTSQEQTLDRYAPKATKFALQAADEAVLSVQAGRTDYYMGALFDILAAKGKGPVLGDLIIPQPQYSTPSYAGVRYDDGRLAKFLQRWGDYSRSMGKTREWILKALKDTGSRPEDIPASADF